MGSREDEESFWKHQGSQQVRGHGKQLQLMQEQGMEVVGDATHKRSGLARVRKI